jgi:FeS assembly SUF system regulator
VLRLSKKADYALIAVTDMAATGGRVLSARELAEQRGLPLELLAKVLQSLARRGLLRSIQGINGGYALVREPSAISVADIVEAIDGPLGLTACDDTAANCEQFAKCSIRDPLHRIRARIASVLSSCSIAELAGVDTAAVSLLRPSLDASSMSARV